MIYSMPQFHQVLEILTSQLCHCQWFCLLLFPTHLKRTLHVFVVLSKFLLKEKVAALMARVPLGSHKGFPPLLAPHILLFMGYLNLLFQKGFGNAFDPQTGISGKEPPWDVLKALTKP